MSNVWYLLDYNFLLGKKTEWVIGTKATKAHGLDSLAYLVYIMQYNTDQH